LCFTVTSIHFSWKLEEIVCLGLFWEFYKNVDMFYQFEQGISVRLKQKKQ